MKKYFSIPVLLLFGSQVLLAQLDTCICQRYTVGCKDTFEVVTEMVMVKHECNGQKAVYQQITKRVLKAPCKERLVPYLCDCKEMRKHYSARVIDIPAEYITIKKYDCDGNFKIERLLIQEKRERVEPFYPPELEVNRN
jgi:hypothetical protein